MAEGEQEGGQEGREQAGAAATGLPEAVQELVLEALTRLDDQQQVRARPRRRRAR